MESIGTPIMWSVFTALVIVALVVDLFVFKQSGPHKVSMREAGLWSVCWIGLALLFNCRPLVVFERQHGRSRRRIALAWNF